MSLVWSVSSKSSTSFPILHSVIPFLYLGNADSRRKVDERGIQKVFEIGTEHELASYFPVSVPTRSIVLSDVRSSRLPLEILEEIHASISEETPVLIHCKEGVSRSVSLVLAYLMRYTSKSLKEAWNLLTSLRRTEIYTHPNVGFMRQLIAYEKKIRGKNSLTLEEYIKTS